MPIIEFLFGKTKGTQLAMVDQDGVDIREMPIDLVNGESHVFENLVTEHPVETGAKLTDHIKANPYKLTLTGLFSDTPISVVDALKRNSLGEPHTLRACPR